LDPAWAACGTGSEQSPVEVGAGSPGSPDVGFSYRSMAGRVGYDGQTIAVTFEPGAGVTVDGVFHDLESATLHTPSEHVVQGEAFEAELQLEHRAADGSLAVVALLIEEGPADPDLDPLLRGLGGQAGHQEPLYGPLDLAELLPEDRALVRYAGSLTAPPCREGVTWVVLTTPTTASAAQLDRARSVVDHTARPLQRGIDRTP
jgi:carbonic anhydrase